jgi:hypothetical protein
MIRARTARNLCSWLLPWLIARLLLPAGVMPFAPTGEPGWVLCSAAALSAAPGTQTSDKLASSDPGGEHRAEAPCPFALAGACAPPPPACRLLERAGVAAPPIPLDAGSRPVSRPLRAHLARGPPQYS